MPRLRDPDTNLRFLRGRKPKSRIDLTDEVLRDLRPRASEYSVHDFCRGFAARVRASGRISLVYQPPSEYGRRRAITLGAFPNVSVAQARARIDRIITAFESETGPVGIAGPKQTVRQAFEQFASDGEFRWAPTYYRKLTTAFRARINPSIGQRHLVSLTAADVYRCVAENSLSSNTRHNDFRFVSSLLAWAVRNGSLDQNVLRGHTPPTRSVSGFTSEVKHGQLSEHDLLEITEQCLSLPLPWPHLVQLIVATGFPAKNLVEVRRGDVDARTGIWTIRNQGANQRNWRKVQLGPLALERMLSLPDLLFHLAADNKNGIAIELPRATLRQLSMRSGCAFFTLRSLSKRVVQMISEGRLNLPEWEDHLQDEPQLRYEIPDDVDL